MHCFPCHFPPIFLSLALYFALFYFSSRKVTPNPIAVKKSKQILLQLLAHPISFVRTQAYAATSAIVKVILCCTLIRFQKSKFFSISLS